MWDGRRPSHHSGVALAKLLPAFGKYAFRPFKNGFIPTVEISNTWQIPKFGRKITRPVEDDGLSALGRQALHPVNLYLAQCYDVQTLTTRHRDHRLQGSCFRIVNCTSKATATGIQDCQPTAFKNPRNHAHQNVKSQLTLEIV